MAISEPVAGVRLIDLTDLETGEPVWPRKVLGLDRVVALHEVVVAHHYCTNKSDETFEIRLGRRAEQGAPGETLHYTGKHRPDQFPIPT